MPTKPFEFPKFDRAEYLRLNAITAEQTAQRLLTDTEVAAARIKDAEEAIRRANTMLSMAQQGWVRCREAEQAFAAALSAPEVDVIDNLTGKVVGTGHLIESTPTSEWFSLDYRASFRRTSYTIVAADTRKGPKPAHVR